MTNSEIYSRLTEVFRDVFDLDDLEVHPELSAADVEEWDSLNHIRLVVAIEKEFQIKISSAKVARLANVGALVALIEGMKG